MNSSPEDIAPLQKFIQEVVDTGFKSGLLRQGMVQYPTMGEIADPEAVAGHAWSQVSVIHTRQIPSYRKS